MNWLILRTLSATYYNAEGGAGGGAAGGDGGQGGAGGAVGGGAGGDGGGEGPWYAKAGVDASHHEWLAAKQFADANTALASYRSLETIVGRQRLAVPQDDKDTAAYDAIYKTLGRPEKADGYKLKDGSKITGDGFKFMAPAFHQAGIGQAQADIILGAYEAEATRLQAAAETERANVEASQVQKLDAEWGSAKAANEDIAARAFRALGIDEASADKIEAALGYAATMKLFHAIGAGMSETALKHDSQKGGQGLPGGSVEGLKSQIQAKFKDEAFMKKYMDSNPRVREPAIKEIEDLQKRIAQLSGAGQ